MNENQKYPYFFPMTREIFGKSKGGEVNGLMAIICLPCDLVIGIVGMCKGVTRLFRYMIGKRNG